MAKQYDQLTESLQSFIGQQTIFFTATAPHEGHINLSPKGMDTLHILDARTIAYLDLTGSGNETAAHLEENGRMTVMFCSFDKQPMILRLYGQGEVIRPRDRRWEALVGRLQSSVTAHFATRRISSLEKLEIDDDSCVFPP